MLIPFSSMCLANWARLYLLAARISSLEAMDMMASIGHGTAISSWHRAYGGVASDEFGIPQKYV